MYDSTSIASQRLLPRVAWNTLAVLLLTSVHHAYGAYVYQTPWRLHVLLVAGPAAAVIVASLVVLQRRGFGAARNLAFGVFAAVILIIPVAAIGLFEGGYNHAAKNVLYFAGASPAVMQRLFPPPTYELPDDLFFELTGVLQLLPAVAAGYLLYRLIRARRRKPSAILPLAVK